VSYANVVATIALFVALSTGGAYAAHLVVDSSDVVDDSLTGADVVGKPGTSTAAAVDGSLTTDDIAGQQRNNGNGTPFIDGTLTQWDIKNSSLVGGDLANNTVGGGKITDNSVGAADLATDSVGPAEIGTEGVWAPEIGVGAVGVQELASLVRVQKSVSVPPGGGVGSVLAECDPGRQRIISGGAYFAFPSGDISASRREAGLVDGWFAEGQNNGNRAQNLTVEAYCIQLGFAPFGG
jgi:hypothetical protein